MDILYIQAVGYILVIRTNIICRIYSGQAGLPDCCRCFCDLDVHQLVLLHPGPILLHLSNNQVQGKNDNESLLFTAKIHHFAFY